MHMLKKYLTQKWIYIEVLTNNIRKIHWDFNLKTT